MKIRFNHWWFRLFPGAGVVLYPYVLFKRAPERTPGRLFRHEMQHVYQVQREGWLKFYVKWLYYTVRYGYKANPYEVVANAVENDSFTAAELVLWDEAVARHRSS